MTPDDLRFDAAINPYGCSAAVVSALETAVRARAYRHYGDPDAGALRAALGRRLDLSPRNLLVYNGSGEGFVWQCLTHLLIGGGAFICPFPSYERFVDVGRRCATRTVEVPLERPSWRLPVDAFIAEARRCEARVAMLSSPNNPTGNRLLDEEALLALLDALPKTTIIVDEAYAEYTNASFAPLVRQRRNLVVLKTFSKAFGLAGLRVGYLAAHEDVADAARRQQIPWAVDSLALLAAEVALSDDAYLRDVVTRIRGDVAAMGAALAEVPGFRVFPTTANFHLVELSEGQWPRLEPALARRGLRVRRRPDMPTHMRVTSMLPEANQVLLETLSAAVRSRARARHRHSAAL